MKYTALIIDDEENGRDAIKSVVAKYCPHITVLDIAKNASDAISKINELAPHLIFLDINLGDGTGFDVLKKVNIIPKTIFITAYNDYAIKAFKVNAVDYLLKPFDPLELVEAVTKTVQILEQKNENDFTPEKTLIKNNDTEASKIVLPTLKGFEVVAIDAINFLESDNNYTIFNLLNGEKKMVSKTLKHFEEMLSPKMFFRCHQKFLVNLNSIIEYQKGEGGFLILKNNIEVDVSRRKKEELITLMHENFLK